MEGNLTVNDVKPASKKKRLIIIVSALLILTIAITSFVYYQKKADEKHRKEVRTAILKDDVLVLKMLSVAADSEEISNQVQTVWHDAIFDDFYQIDGHYTSDFNEAIQYYFQRSEVQTKVDDINTKIGEVEKSLKDIQNQPKELKEDRNLIYSIYKPLKQFSDLAISPEGNLQAFQNNTSDLDNKVSSAFDDWKIKKVNIDKYEDKKK